MGCFSLETYRKFENIIHPNVKANIDHYRDGDRIFLPVYHGCGEKNRNGTRKKIDYKRGEQCLFGTNKHFWKPFKEITRKHLQTKIYFTRCISNLGLNDFAKCKGNYWYDWNEKKYRPKSDWFNGRQLIAPV